MVVRHTDVLLVDETEHIGYLTGWHATGSMYHAVLVPLLAEPVVVLRRLDEAVFLERSWIPDRMAIADTEEPIDVVAGVIRARGWAEARIGLELDSHYLTVQRYQALRTALPDATLVDFAGVLREFRLVKSPAEIACLRRAAAIADAAMREAVTAMQEVSETVLVTEDGSERLTRLERRLFVR
jgi:Xaa-Pro dipeptidase